MGEDYYQCLSYKTQYSMHLSFLFRDLYFNNANGEALARSILVQHNILWNGILVQHNSLQALIVVVLIVLANLLISIF